MKDMILSNAAVLKAAGVSDELIGKIKTADAATNVNTLSAIYNVLMGVVRSTHMELAKASNPYGVLERGYAEFNDGSQNGFFREILRPMRDKGANQLYGAENYNVKVPKNPWTAQDYGKEPIQYLFGINAKIERDLDWNIADFAQVLLESDVKEWMRINLATLAEEDRGMMYAIEDRCINAEEFQNATYASQPVQKTASELNLYIQKVFDSQRFLETNVAYKRVPFNTVRETKRDLVLIMQIDFYREFAEKFQFGSFLKPFAFSEWDNNGNVTSRQVDRIILVPSLTASKISTSGNGEYDPIKINETPPTMPANSKLIGRIVDANAVKFGRGRFDAADIRLDARKFHRTEVSDYCFNMCDGYVNVPLIVSDTAFDFDRKIHTVTKVDGTVTTKAEQA